MRRSRLSLIALLAVGSTFAACTANPDANGSDFYNAVVFPGESLAGGTAAMVIDSNYIPRADSWERYDLHRYDGVVEIFVEDPAGTPVEAPLRTVTAIGASASSRLGERYPGAWISVAIFDVPDFAVSTPYTAAVTVSTRGELRGEFHGTLRILGRGGTPTRLTALGNPEDWLGPQLMMRFRPVRRTPAEPNGFPEGATIGALQVDIDYDDDCLASPRAYPNTEAAHANVLLSPPKVVASGVRRSTLLITHPQGFTLGIPEGQSDTAAGEGPLFDVAFDRGAGGCEGLSASWVTLSNLYVVGTDGNALIDMRKAANPDSSGLFTDHLVDVP